MKVTYIPKKAAKKRGSKKMIGNEKLLYALAAKHPTMSEDERKVLIRFAERFGAKPCKV